ncbi:hypothetical protein CRD60_04110 [Bifidobacterium aemilianum]|uniref:Uncharacterized protein n=1 Tax=Bifidobacterium aemilianum TaxID=2493120 RepID=A0A366K9E6_9BIFI|nr:InlB B-repeat-containing protein [Bifidobacterium aemilianum]RBP97788.1 hypothetical protein CRD60_04110 [Bifidobacterium aemilianum]
MVLTAKWTNRVKVTFDLGAATGHIAPIAERTMDKGSSLNAPTPAAWDHGNFQGWYTDPGLTRPWSNGPVNANTTLHANWQQHWFITVHANWPGASPAGPWEHGP